MPTYTVKTTDLCAPEASRPPRKGELVLVACPSADSVGDVLGHWIADADSRELPVEDRAAIREALVEHVEAHAAYWRKLLVKAEPGTFAFAYVAPGKPADEPICPALDTWLKENSTQRRY